MQEETTSVNEPPVPDLILVPSLLEDIHHATGGENDEERSECQVTVKGEQQSAASAFLDNPTNFSAALPTPDSIFLHINRTDNIDDCL